MRNLSARGHQNLAPDHFDVVIVDEFHHAAAATYDALLRHLQPVELLGLTATPERSDGLPVLHWFDDRIAAELDPERARVQGEETITYHNRSPDTLEHLVLLLYQNVFAPGVQRVRRVPPTDGITLELVQPPARG